MVKKSTSITQYAAKQANKPSILKAALAFYARVPTEEIWYSLNLVLRERLEAYKTKVNLLACPIKPVQFTVNLCDLHNHNEYIIRFNPRRKNS